MTSLRAIALIAIALFTMLSVRPALGALPRMLSSSEVDQIVEIFSEGSVGRLLRTAEPYRLYPGVKVGIEFNILPTKDIGTYGDGTGSIPGVLFMPRLYVAKGLYFGFEMILNISPTSAIGGLATQSIMLKWTASAKEEKWGQSALFIGYTHVSGFDDEYNGSAFEFGGLLSKDIKAIRGFAGLGFLFANGSVLPELARTKNSASPSTLHLFVGGEWNGPVNVTLQIDFRNLSLMSSLFVGKKF